MEEIEQLHDEKTGFRFYKKGNLLRPGVSTAVSHIKHKSLIAWHISKEKEEQEEIVKNAQNLGTEFHRIAHNLAEGIPVGKVPEELKLAIKSLDEFLVSTKMESQSSEKYVFSTEFGYGGTYDRIATIDGKKTLIDWKSGRYSNIDLWKTTAYSMAYKEMTGEDLEIMVVYFSKEGKEPKKYTVQHKEFCFTSFLSCLHTWKGLYFNDLRKIGIELEWLTENPLKKYYIK